MTTNANIDRSVVVSSPVLLAARDTFYTRWGPSVTRWGIERSSWVANMPDQIRSLLPPWPPEWPEIPAAAQQSFVSGDWGRYHSQTCTDLENRLKERAGGAATRLCCSGTAAIEIALRVAGVQAGDEVIIAAMDYPGNFRSIEAVGAKPVLVDVAIDSPCMDVASVAAVAQASSANQRVVAVMASHLWGHFADMQRLQSICNERGWVLINDACQVIGMHARLPAPGLSSPGPSSPVERWGDLATLSFGGSKVVTAGAGGAIIAHHDRFAAKLGSLMDRPSEVFAMSPLQAAVIGPQLDRLAEMHQRRNDCVRYLLEHADSFHRAGLRIQPNPDASVFPAYYKLAIEAPSADSRAKSLDRASAIGLPLGAGFRSMHRSSDRRCRKPVPLDRSQHVGETGMVLDQRALLVEPRHRLHLREALLEIACLG